MRAARYRMRDFLKGSFFKAALMLVCAMVFVSCNTKNDSSDADVILEIWQGFNNEETEVFERVLVDFRKKFAAESGKSVAFKMTRVSFGDVITKLRTAAIAKQAPDIVMMDVNSLTDLAFWQAFTKIDELDGFKKEFGSVEKARKEFFQASFDKGVINRKGQINLYALPVQSTCISMYWNKKLFREKTDELKAAGLDAERAPQTWEEFFQYAEILTQADDGVYGLGLSGSLWFNFAILNMYDVEMVSYDESGRAVANVKNERTFAAINRLREIANSGFEGGAWKDGGMTPENGFVNNKYAMIFSGPWMVKDFTNSKIDFDIALLPAPGQQEIKKYGLEMKYKFAGAGDASNWSSSNLGGQSGVIMRESERAEEAYKFLSFFASEKIQKRWANELGQIPVRPSIWDEIDPPEYPYLKNFVNQLRVAKGLPQIIRYGKLEELFNNELKLAFENPDISTETMLDDVERGMNQRLLDLINESLD